MKKVTDEIMLNKKNIKKVMTKARKNLDNTKVPINNRIAWVNSQIRFEFIKMVYGDNAIPTEEYQMEIDRLNAELNRLEYKLTKIKSHWLYKLAKKLKLC